MVFDREVVACKRVVHDSLFGDLDGTLAALLNEDT